MNMPNPIFTIGHSDHEIDRFIELLRMHEIGVVVDVRSTPYSRLYPHFNREQVQAALKRASIQYGFFGRELGARRSEPECYVGPQARYDLIAKTPLFRDGLSRLQQGSAGHRIALMCAEKDPLTCHRSILICRQLRPAAISHILEDGSLEPHERLEQRLMKEVGIEANDLFRTAQESLEQAYELQGDKIAYSGGLGTLEEAG
jgi:uncharacterized protein (DUF488 family)